MPGPMARYGHGTDMARQGTAWTRHDMARHGTAWHGHGTARAWHGTGMARHGHGTVRHGHGAGYSVTVGLQRARHGMARGMPDVYIHICIYIYMYTEYYVIYI